ncbi:MAG: ATPase [Planktomarina sp.]
MLYSSAHDWLNAPKKRVLLFAMSGLGKTHVSNMLRHDGGWFHYSIDYRIGTRYMGEHIVDNCIKAAMKDPFLAELLRSNSIYIASNITFDNLAPLSAYLGKPGDTAKGGISMDEYKRRQAQHTAGEKAALLDTAHFIQRAEDLYGYENFVCDTGGSIVEVVDPWDSADPIMKALSDATLMVWIKGSDAHTDDLIARFDKAPKPMCYQPEFLAAAWADYLQETGNHPDQVDPNSFIRWTYAKAMAHREPRYAKMADWGITLAAEDVATARDPKAFVDLVAAALEDRASNLT